MARVQMKVSSEIATELKDGTPPYKPQQHHTKHASAYQVLTEIEQRGGNRVFVISQCIASVIETETFTTLSRLPGRPLHEIIYGAREFKLGEFPHYSSRETPRTRGHD